MFLNCFLLVFLIRFCSSRDTITINQVIADGYFLTSAGSNFKLGFFTPGNSTYRYLGIWFQKVSPQTVVWVANRDNPINGSSGVLSINKYGNLVLYENRNPKTPIWSTNVSMTGKTVAQLLDSGDLVVFHYESNKIVWQSFDYPTDTFLPGMKIGLDHKTGLHRIITSWKSADDPGTGEYSFKLNVSGGSSQYFLYKGSTPQWRTNPQIWRLFVSDDLKYFYHSSEDELYISYSLVDASDILRIWIGYSGSIKILKWRSSSNKWKEVLSLPKTQCEKYGECGAYSKCNPYIADKFHCTCLPGYMPKFPSNWSMGDASEGCIRKHMEKVSFCGHGDGFVKVTSVKLPDTTVGWMSTTMSSKECQQACLGNCSCTAYTVPEISPKTSICMLWFGELVDIVERTIDGDNDLFVRVPPAELAENMTKSDSFLDRKMVQRILVISVSSSWLILIILVCLWKRKRRKRKVLKKKWRKLLFDRGSNYYNDSFLLNELEERKKHPDIVCFTPNVISAATNNFSPSNKIGQGGFGSVYKGHLSNGRDVAVKVLCKTSGQGTGEFKNELLLIAKLQHRNLVELLGCCIQGEELMIVYEYLPNKSLDSFLFDETRRALLDWRKRFNILAGIARGLLYLHQDSRLRIVHRDLKTSNILLDAEMNPKISDFGMARIFKGDQIQDQTKRVAGTYGYMAPEYVVFGKFSVKSDVFSFGVILLEIVTGKKTNSFCKEDSPQSLIGHVWELWSEGRAQEVVDSSLNLSYYSDEDEVMRCIRIGLLCVQEDLMDRPDMSGVVLMLNGDQTNLPYPGQPAFVFRKSSPTREEQVCSINEVTITGITTR